MSHVFWQPFLLAQRNMLSLVIVSTLTVSIYLNMCIISNWRFFYVRSVVNIGATALVTDAATAIFGEAGVSAATGVMTVCL